MSTYDSDAPVSRFVSPTERVILEAASNLLRDVSTRAPAGSGASVRPLSPAARSES
jgi:hypothetical protein